MISTRRPRWGALLVLGLGWPTITYGQDPAPDAAPEAESEDARRFPIPITEGVDYRVYDREGRPSSILALVSAARDSDVLLVGEEHDDMVGHAVESLLLETVLEEIGGRDGSDREVVLSLEMFERDVQYIIDEYLAGHITEAHFKRSARPWPFYEERYRPLVEVARERGIPLVAANAPRRYVNRVTNEGPESLEALSAHARAFLPPLPYPGPSDPYRAQWDALMTEEMLGMEREAATEDEAARGEAEHGDPASAAGGRDQDEPEGHRTEEAGTEEHGAEEGQGEQGHEEEGSEEESGRPELNPNAIYSQALWDASMGHAITEALVRHMGGFVVHFVGSFHVAQGTGIPERIVDYRPGTRVVTVVMEVVDDIDAWSEEEHGVLADYVVLTERPEEEGAAPGG